MSVKNVYYLLLMIFNLNKQPYTLYQKATIILYLNGISLTSCLRTCISESIISALEAPNAKYGYIPITQIPFLEIYLKSSATIELLSTDNNFRAAPRFTK